MEYEPYRGQSRGCLHRVFRGPSACVPIPGPVHPSQVDACGHRDGSPCVNFVWIRVQAV